jgi:hypothetical protein
VAATALITSHQRIARPEWRLETDHDGDTVINRINQRTVAFDRDNDVVSLGRISTGQSGLHSLGVWRCKKNIPDDKATAIA